MLPDVGSISTVFAGLDLALGLEGVDQRHADAVLDRRQRIEELELEQHAGVERYQRPAILFRATSGVLPIVSAMFSYTRPRPHDVVAASVLMLTISFILQPSSLVMRAGHPASPGRYARGSISGTTKNRIAYARPAVMLAGLRLGYATRAE